MSDRFEIKETTVLDTKTGLEWAREVLGPMHWKVAMDAAQAKGDGWRLPTIEELITLINFSRCEPASEFPGQPSVWFWSSSSYALNASSAWSVNFGYGNVDNNGKTYSYCARCVRGGKEM